MEKGHISYAFFSLSLSLPQQQCLEQPFSLCRNNNNDNREWKNIQTKHVARCIQLRNSRKKNKHSVWNNMHKTAFLHFIWITYENDKSFRQCGEQRPSLHLKVAALRLALLNYRNIRLNFSLPAFSEFWRIWEKMLYKTNQTHLNWGMPERNCLCSNFCFCFQ